jgi:flagellar operon protein (TIGR03826 family)
MNLANCPRCGKLYSKNIQNMCLSCIKEIDNEYEICAVYLKENRGCSINELSESTEVSIRQITKFIRDGRISILQAPNLSYPCESCGASVQEGSMCANCRQKFIKAFGSANDSGKKDQANQQKTTEGAYRTINRLRD